MTTQRHERIPEWTLGDRLRKARELTGLGQREFASEIGVSHQTVTNAEKGHRAVRKITLNAWQMRTGVDRHWLETGEVSGGDGDGGPSVMNGYRTTRTTALPLRRAA